MGDPTLALRIKTPTVPNFVFLESPAVRRQDGARFDAGVDVATLTDEQVEAVIGKWAEEFRRNVRRRRD